MLTILALLFTILINSTVECQFTDKCSNVTCHQNQLVCAKITRPNEMFYQMLYACEAAKIKCELENIKDDVRLSKVSMSKCNDSTSLNLKKMRIKNNPTSKDRLRAGLRVGKKIATHVSSTVERQVPDKCANVTCHQNQLICAKITRPSETFYQMLYACEAAHIQCELANNKDDIKISKVNMSKCNDRPTLKLKKIKIKNNPTSKDGLRAGLRAGKKIGRLRQYHDSCPKSCPVRGLMVCARSGDGTQRTFLSDCFMRMFQCKHPTEKLELMSRQSCTGPSLKNLQQSKNFLKEPSNQDLVLDHIYSHSSTYNITY